MVVSRCCCRTILFLLVVVNGIFAPPLNHENKRKSGVFSSRLQSYVDEVIALLFESDADNNLLENGTFRADTLHLLDPDVVNRLHELKRRTAEELVEINRVKRESKGRIDVSLPIDLVNLLGQNHPHKYTHDDLTRLTNLNKLVDDKVDAATHAAYESELIADALDRWEILLADTPEQRQKDKERYEKEIETRRQHEKFAQPGSLTQEKAEWESEGFDRDFYNSKAFFKLHDVDNDGYIDPNELRAVLTKVLSGVHYNYTNPEDLLRKEVDLEYMLNNTLKSIDLDDDGLISEQEHEHYRSVHQNDEDLEWQPEYDNERIDVMPTQEGMTALKGKIEDLEHEFPEVQKFHRMKEKLDTLRAHLSAGGDKVA